MTFSGRRRVTGGGGGTRGGGAGRDTNRILTDVKTEYAADYDEAADKSREAVEAYLAGNPRNPFADRKWRKARRTIALILYAANAAATGRVNDVLPEAFADGATLTAFTLNGQIRGGGGGTRGGGAGRYSHSRSVPEDETKKKLLPYTKDVVLALIAAGLITVTLRELNRRKDIAWNEKRLQAIANAEIISGTAADDLPDAIARKVADGAKKAMDTAAQARIYGACDSGAYQAGLDAEALGLDIDKTWLGIPDARIRPSHRHLDGQTRPIHTAFMSFHGAIRYPHDPKAHPAETMRCRCALAIHLHGHRPWRATRMLAPSQVRAYLRWRREIIAELGGEVALAEAHRRRHNASV